MKNSMKSFENTNIATIFMTLVALMGISGAQADPIQQQEHGQTVIVQDTDRLSGQLDGLVNEFERNGLSGSDVDVLKAIQSVLHELSTEQMPVIIRELGKGKITASLREKRMHLLTASGDQKSAAIQMRQLLLEHQLQIELHHLADRVQELGNRQSRNLHETIALVIAQGKRNAARRANEFRVSRQLQETEQSVLNDEITAILARLEQIHGEKPNHGTIETRPGEALELAAAESLTEQLSTSQTEIAADRLMNAAGHERRARNTLWRLARTLSPAGDRLQQLLAMKRELDTLVTSQESVIAATEVLRSVDELPGDIPAQIENTSGVKRTRKQLDNLEKHLELLGWLKERQIARTPEDGRARVEESWRKRQENFAVRLREERRLVAEEIREVYEYFGALPPEDQVEREAENAQKQQAMVADKADFFSGELESLAPHASVLLGNAIDPMQQARTALGSAEAVPERKAAAIPPEKTALAKLIEARDAVINAIAEEEIASVVPADKIDEIKALLDRVRKLRDQEQDLKTKSDAAEKANDADAMTEQAARQEALQQSTERLQADSAASAPDSSKAIGRASEAMTDSARALAASQNAPQAQQQAIDSLTQAEQLLAERLAELEQAQEQLDALQALRDKVSKIYTDQETTQRQAIEQIENPEAPQNQELPQDQAQLQTQTSEAQSEAQTTAPDAAPDLGDAAEQMADANENLQNGQPADAQPAQSAALQDLSEALEKIDRQMASLANQLGTSPPPSDTAAALQAIAQAQQSVAQALAQSSPPVAPLNAASSAIAPLNAGQMGPLPGSMAQPLQAAQASLSQAAAQSATDQPAQAQASAQAAQASLAQAAAAMSLAQAGLGTGMAQAQGQGQSLSPGQGAGQVPGQGQGTGQAPGTGQVQGQGPPPPRGTGDTGNWAGAGGANGPRRTRTGGSGFIGLPGRERESLRQSRSEKYPQQFKREIEEYFRKLSEAADEEESQ